MTVIHGVDIDCGDATELSTCWQAVLGWDSRIQEPDWCSLRNPVGGPHLSFQQVPEEKVVKNRVHLDIRPETGSLEEEPRRIEALGARSLKFFDKGEWSHWVMADPDGKEFCVLSPEHVRATRARRRHRRGPALPRRYSGSQRGWRAQMWPLRGH